MRRAWRKGKKVQTLCSKSKAVYIIQGRKGGPGPPSPPDFWKNKNDCVFNKHTIKVCVNYSWQCSETSAPNGPHLAVSFYLCSLGSKGRDELRGIEGRSVSSKSSSRVWDWDEGVAGRNRKEKYFSNGWSLIWPPGKSMIFFTRDKYITKIELVARPVVCQLRRDGGHFQSRLRLPRSGRPRLRQRRDSSQKVRG